MIGFRSGRFASLVLTAALGLVASVASVAAVSENAVTTAAAKVQHVFVIILENRSFSDTFGTSTQDPYLQKTLVPAGALLTQYYGTGHVSLDNYISLISGQAPTADTDNDCVPGLSQPAGNFNNVEQHGETSDGQVVASGGCVYPAKIKTIADQLVAKGLTWKGYMGDMGNDPARESATCGHPAIGVGTDHTNEAEAPSAAVPLGDAYATRHDPFVYFHSIINQPSCKKRVVNLDKLTADLQKVATTPNFVFITPNLCDDGHDGSGTGAPGTLCANGAPGGLTSADAFLQKWVPVITASPAYKKNGLIVITFDESALTQSITRNGSQTVVNITAAGATCCYQQPGPNISSVRPASETLVNTPSLVETLIFQSYGGDQVGALLLSPFIKPGTTSATPYNHYSMLRSLENIFGLGHLGYAANRFDLNTIGTDKAIFKAKSSS